MVAVATAAGVAAVEPGDAEPTAGLGPERGEAMFGGRAVVVHGGHLFPGLAAVQRGLQADVVGIGRVAVFHQHVRPKTAVVQDLQRGKVGPVHEPVRTFGCNTRALPVAFLVEAAVGQAVAAAVTAFDPAQHQVAIGRQGEIGLRGTIGRRQRPVGNGGGLQRQGEQQQSDGGHFHATNLALGRIRVTVAVAEMLVQRRQLGAKTP